MSLIDLCGTAGANTGRIKCDKSKGVPLIPIIGGAEFTPAQTASNLLFQAALVASMNLANGSSGKMYPFPEIQNVVDNTEAPTNGATGLGTTVRLREGKPSYTFGVFAGINLEKALRKFDNTILPVMMYDNGKNIWGKKNSVGNFVGVDALINVTAKPFEDGNTVDKKYVNISISYLSMSDFSDYSAFIPTDFNVNDLEGLIDVQIYETSANAANVYNLGAEFINTEIGGNQSMYLKFDDELANDELWSARTGIGFITPIAITSVAKDEDAGGWVVTLDSADYAALGSEEQIRIGLATPDVLMNAGVRGIEGVPVVVSK